MYPADLRPLVEDRLRAREREAAAERLTRRRVARHFAAAWLRGVADRLDPLPAPPGALAPSGVAGGRRA